MSTVITVENLGKKYTISHQQRDDSSSLRDVITNGVKNFSKRVFSPFTPHSSPLSASEDFRALQDVTFEVKQGDRIGIIGRNGAGKSTLLKILSRITEPTTGSIRIKGRVASLLEVGTGFHPELTGRENIFLNGAILGMQRDEIRRKFDEIVDFAEIEKFLDTPVKRYSSGMYVRLAFAVAAHLEPEILIVDEVLAVGDAPFQKKCLGKMEDVGREGRTVLFVSHNMGAIERLCSSCIWLQKGELTAYSQDVRETVSHYLNASSGKVVSDYSINKFRTEFFYLSDLDIRDHETQQQKITYTKNDKIEITLLLEHVKENRNLSIGYALFKKGIEEPLWWSFNVDKDVFAINSCTQRLHTCIPSGLLNDGEYTVEILSAIHNQRWIMAPGSNTVSATFHIEGGGLGSEHMYSTKRPTILMPVFSWTAS